jgi:8-oxo-dGTP pyrophosphatase MutT (NUDIX family)
MILRLGKWDLPKGKMEKNEEPMICAIREVEEECGIKAKIIENMAILRPNCGCGFNLDKENRRHGSKYHLLNKNKRESKDS